MLRTVSAGAKSCKFATAVFISPRLAPIGAEVGAVVYEPLKTAELSDIS